MYAIGFTIPQGLPFLPNNFIETTILVDGREVYLCFPRYHNRASCEADIEQVKRLLAEIGQDRLFTVFPVAL